MLQTAVLWLHELVLSLKRLQNTLNQILFFVVMEKVMCPSQRYASLYLLLFYTVLCYLQHSLKTHHWTKLINETNAADLVRLTTAFILARLAKGVAMSFVLVTFTLHVSDLQPSCAYIAVTGFYFICTEFPESLSPDHWSVSLLRKLDLHVLEGLEELWLPVLIHSSALFLSAIALVFSGPGNWTLRLLLGYHNLVISWKRLKDRCVSPAVRAEVADPALQDGDASPGGGQRVRRVPGRHVGPRGQGHPLRTRLPRPLPAPVPAALQALPPLQAGALEVNHVSAMALSTDINDLPDELLLKCFSYLSLDDLVVSVHHVNKRWQALSNDAELWKNKQFIAGSYYKRSEVINILKSAPQLKYIIFTAPVDFSMFHVLSRSCPNLIDLEVSCRQKLGAKVMAKIVSGCKKIESLMLPSNLFSNLKFVKVVARMKMLKKLCLTELMETDTQIFLKPLAKGCPALKNLFIGTCPFRMDDLDKLVSAKSHQLESLNLRWSEANRNSVTSIKKCGSALKNLTLWDYDHCIPNAVQAFQDLQEFSNLEKLILPSLSIMPSETVTRLFHDRKLSQLKEIDLRDPATLVDSVVSAIINGCPLLEKLYLIGADDITDVSLKDIRKCPMLNLLDISGCVSLSWKAILYVSECLELRELHLGYLEVETLSWKVDCLLLIKNLRVLNLEYSDVTNIPFEKFPTCFPKLKLLILSRCRALDELVVKSLGHKMPDLKIDTYPLFVSDYPSIFDPDYDEVPYVDDV